MDDHRLIGGHRGQLIDYLGQSNGILAAVQLQGFLGHGRVVPPVQIAFVQRHGKGGKVVVDDHYFAGGTGIKALQEQFIGGVPRLQLTVLWNPNQAIG